MQIITLYAELARTVCNFLDTMEGLPIILSLKFQFQHGHQLNIRNYHREILNCIWRMVHFHMVTFSLIFHVLETLIASSL